MQLSIDLRRVNTEGETPDIIEKGWLKCFDGQPAYVGIPFMVVVLTTANILSVNACNALWKTEFIGSFLYLSSGIGCTLATRLRFGYSRWYVPIAIAVAEASTCWWFTGDGFAMVVFAGVNVMKAIKIREALQKYYTNPKAFDEEDVAKAVGLAATKPILQLSLYRLKQKLRKARLLKTSQFLMNQFNQKSYRT